MKCKKILYSLLFFFFFQSSCIALCLTDKVDFGDSLSKVSEKLKIPPITKSIIGKEGKEYLNKMLSGLFHCDYTILISNCDRIPKTELLRTNIDFKKGILIT